jgi:type I restriction enzyme S subunit
MNSEWEECRWGDVATLEYGKSLRTYRNDIGKYPVYGTNGLIGWNDEAVFRFL